RRRASLRAGRSGSPRSGSARVCASSCLTTVAALPASACSTRHVRPGWPMPPTGPRTTMTSCSDCWRIRGCRLPSRSRSVRGAAAEAADRAGQDDDEWSRLRGHPGLSTAEQVTGLSGRGVGLDVVVSRLRALGGAIDMSTRPGEGTTFTLRLPITLALARALRVRVGGEDYAVPLTHITEAVELSDHAVQRSPTGESVRVRDELLPLVRLGRVLRAPRAGAESAAVIAELGQRRTALAVDEIVGHEQILVKQFDAAFGALPYFS